MTAPTRFGYMTNNLENLDLARVLAREEGFVVDMLPPDAPTPEPGTYDGIMVDLEPAGRHALERKTFLDKLKQVAKVFPVEVNHPSASYGETAAIRAAGMKWFPTLRPKVFGLMLTHPLASSVAAAKAARAAAAAEATVTATE